MNTSSATAVLHDTSTQETREAVPSRVITSGLNVFFRLAQAWKLSTKEQRILLGQPARATFFRWKKRRTGEVPRDTLERIASLYQIYNALHKMLPAEAADSWIRRPNKAAFFAGKSALEFMLDGSVQNLCAVRAYVQAQALW